MASRLLRPALSSGAGLHRRLAPGPWTLRPGLVAFSSFHSSATVSTTTTEHLPRRPTRSLAGKVAIVTGAGCQGDGLGNGRAISLLLAEDGAAVVCADRVAQWADRTAEMVNDEGRGRASSCQGDVTEEADCRRIIEAAMSRFGRLDVLVNNVGVMGAEGTATEVQPGDWARGLEVNVTSMMLMAKHAIPEMAKNEAADGNIRGSIVLMGSVAGLQGGTPHLLYPTSKGAVVNMARAMAAHHASEGIRVNCVCPGMLYTPMMYNAGMTPGQREARRKRSLLRTEGSAWDTAGAVRFLAGGEARWITGAILTVDAGATAAVAVANASDD